MLRSAHAILGVLTLILLLFVIIAGDLPFLAWILCVISFILAVGNLWIAFMDEQ